MAAEIQWEGGHPLETSSFQASCVGPHHFALLPQLGNVYIADLDADVLQPGEPDID